MTLLLAVRGKHCHEKYVWTPVCLTTSLHHGLVWSYPDYVYPRTTNKILRLYLLKKGVKEADIQEEYTPFHHQDYQTIVGKIKSFCAGGDAAVINTINGDSNVPFFKELANQGVTADKTPTMSYSFAEVELQTLDVKPLVGHLASWN